MKTLKIYHVGGNIGYSNWIENSEPVNSLQEADLVIFTGGEDVHPYFYEEPVHPRTYFNTVRDKQEEIIFKAAIELNIPILGVCRGSQLSCVMAGGKLVQHQNNPSFKHPIKTYNNVELTMSSTHHQAQHPFNLPEENYKILAWSEDIVKYREDGNQQEMKTPKDCEIVYYPKINTLAIQGHPEMILEEEETIKWCRELLLDFLNKQL